jgi:hypothetical protein
MRGRAAVSVSTLGAVGDGGTSRRTVEALAGVRRVPAVPPARVPHSAAVVAEDAAEGRE